MAEDETDGPTDERHPIVAGLLALLAVGLTVGLILGGAALAATQVLGLGDEGSASDDSSSDASLYLPHSEKDWPRGRPTDHAGSRRPGVRAERAEGA